MSEIIFDHFSCWYKEKKAFVPALDDLTFQIREGEFFVVAGESGSGKTTLLNCVLGLCEYTKGSLTVDGVPEDETGNRLSNVGYVRQEADLYPHLTVYENVAFPLRAMRTEQQEVDRRVKELARRMEVDWLLTRIPRQLSGGQQQRVAIARALIKKPTLLLFDEPFSDLEPALRGQLRRLVKALQREYGTTVLFVTHDLPDAFALADRLLVLENGRAADLGTPMELVKDCRSDLLKGFLK